MALCIVSSEMTTRVLGVGRTNLVLSLFFSVAAGDHERSRKVSQEGDWLDCVADQF